MILLLQTCFSLFLLYQFSYSPNSNKRDELVWRACVYPGVE